MGRPETAITYFPPGFDIFRRLADTARRTSTSSATYASLLEQLGDPVFDLDAQPQARE